MLIIMILVSAISGAMMVLFGFLAMHLRKTHPFLNKKICVEVKTVYKIPEKADVDGNPLFEINGNTQKVPNKAKRQAWDQGKRPSDISCLYIHLDGSVDVEKRHNEVVMSESIMLLEGDYVIQTKRELKFYKQYRNLEGWIVLMILLVSASLDLLILLIW